MAVTAKFQADFSSFLQAVQQADVQLADFGKGASNVEARLNRMVDSFSGRQLIQEATLMGAAIQKVGGVSQLSATDLERVGLKASEAAAFMKRLGLDGATAMQQLADRVNSAKGFTLDLSSAASVAAGALGALGVNVGLSGIVNFGKELFTAADNLVKLHDKTGISIEGLQRFQVAGDDAGNTIDQISLAITKMENKLVSGDGSAEKALEKLGLSFEDLKNLTPENQFIAISDAIRKIQDPAEQVNIAMGLFGKSGAEVLPTLKRGFDDVRGAAVGMSAETVKAFDDAGDAIAAWWRRTKGVTAEAVVEFARLAGSGFDPGAKAAADMAREANSLAETLDKLVQKAESAAPTIKALVPPGLPEDLEEINKKFADDAKALTAIFDATEALTAATVGWQTTLDTVNGSVAEAIKFYLSAGVSQKDLATAYGLTAQQIKAVAIALEEESSALSSEADFARIAGERRLEITRQMTAATNELVTAEFQRQQAEKATNDAFLEETLAAAKAQDALANGLTTVASSATGATAQMGQFRNLIQLSATDMSDLNEQLTKFYSQLAQRSPVGDFSGPSGIGIPVGNSAGIPWTGHANGIVNAPVGHWAMVGERGPEPMYVPKGSTILPSGSDVPGGGTQVIQLVVDGRVLAQIVDDQKTRSMKQSRQYPAS